MAAINIRNDKSVRDDGLIIQRVIWLLPAPVPPCVHRYKYRLFFGTPTDRIIGFDNERGKGDHVHIYRREIPYTFRSTAMLLENFATLIGLADKGANQLQVELQEVVRRWPGARHSGTGDET
jgi:hypothetical protein